jgi:hypothetical protein
MPHVPGINILILQAKETAEFPPSSNVTDFS